MRLQVIAVGRLKAGPERDLVERYQARCTALGRGLGFTGPILLELPEGRERRAEERQAGEGERIRERAGPSSLVIFDENAPLSTSEDFARRLAGWRDDGRETLSLVIGGPDGLHPRIKGLAVWSVSFGRMTLPHQLVRALALEQLYRAFTIIAGHPYHRAGGGEA